MTPFVAWCYDYVLKNYYYYLLLLLLSWYVPNSASNTATNSGAIQDSHPYSPWLQQLQNANKVGQTRDYSQFRVLLYTSHRNTPPMNGLQNALFFWSGPIYYFCWIIYYVGTTQAGWRFSRHGWRRRKMEQPIKIDLGRHGIRSDESIKSDRVSLDTENRCYSVLKGKHNCWLCRHISSCFEPW